MTDFVINEKDGMEAVRLISRNNPQTAQAFESVFRSRPLSQELKKERKRVLDALIIQIEYEQQKQYKFFYPCFDKNTIVPIKEWGYSLEQIISKAQSLRSEQP